LHLKIGDVIWWHNFPYQKAGNTKPRWFIYLGRSSLITSPVFLYLCTTTTQLQHFESSGNRSNHACKRFNVNQFPIFQQDCILDYDEDVYTLLEEKLIEFKANIEIKGTLDKDTMRNIYKQFLRSDVCSLMMLIDLHDSFNRDGITGLKRPS
jgi:hypothetical protein